MAKVYKLLVTRNECREMGLGVSNTTFQRWEDAGLIHAIKLNGRASIVRYRLRDVLRLIASRTERRVPRNELELDYEE
jgi:hypothetical protein